MRQLTVIQLLGFAGMATFVASSANDQDFSHCHGAGSFGQSCTRMDPARTTGILLPGVSTIDSTTKQRGDAFKVFAGYQMHRNIAVEGGCFDHGNSRFTSRTAPTDTLTGQTRGQGLHLDPVGALPLTDRFSGWLH